MAAGTSPSEGRRSRGGRKTPQAGHETRGWLTAEPLSDQDRERVRNMILGEQPAAEQVAHRHPRHPDRSPGGARPPADRRPRVAAAAAPRRGSRGAGATAA